MKVSFFKSIRDISPYTNKDVSIFLDRIKDGKSQKIIERLRFEPDKDIQTKIKLELPVVRFGGEFVRSGNDHVKKSSGLMILDFDHLENAVDFKKQLVQNDLIFSAWISPRGNGVKALIKIPFVDNDSQYKSIFKEVNKVFDYLDQSGKDISRACFESYDPEIYVNLESKKFEYIPENVIEPINIGTKTNIPITNQDEIANRLLVWFKKTYTGTERNNSIFRLASAFNDFGINRSTAEIYLNTFEEPDFKISEILAIINSAYKKTANFGTKQFEDSHKKEKIKSLVLAGKNAEQIKNEFQDLEFKKLSNEVDAIESKLDLKSFWDQDKRTGELSVNAYRLKRYLESLNYFKFFPIGQNKPFVLISKTENFVDVVSEFKMKDDILDRLINMYELDAFNLMADKVKVWTPQYLSMLDTATVAIEKDGKDYAMIYYKNNAVKVFSDRMEIFDYNDLQGFVWANQIIQRDFIDTDHHDSMFRRFIWLIAGEEVCKYNTFKSVLGYLLHSYKTSANNKAIILNDETISENPNGGSGKGILMNAVGHMKKLSPIDGKTFDFNKSFAYQTVSTDCQVLAFDDVKRNFEFERLFSLITEGITIEYKNQGAVKLPIADSPKIMITTNYTIKTNGGSFQRRVFEVELSSFFNANYSPIDEFGCLLFTDWSDLEWSRFDKFMINCLQYYLENGLVKSEPKNLALRKFINDTCQEFFDYCESGNLTMNTRLIKSEAYKHFKDENDDLKWLTNRLFNKWVRLLCEFKSWEYEEGNSNGARWFQINDGNEVQKDIPPF